MAKSLKDKLTGSEDPEATDETEPPVEATVPDTDLDADEFRAQQKFQAEAQNQTADNAVPEQRPQAFLASPAPHSDLTQRLIDEGEINLDPMPPEAFARAQSQEAKDAAAEAGIVPALHPGNVVKVTQGPHRDRTVAITRVLNYTNSADLAIKTAGGPDARFVQPQEVEGRAIGDDRDGEILILNVIDAGLELIRDFRSLARR